jgi:macrolide-specific efflux system membrane fusion protein
VAQANLNAATYKLTQMEAGPDAATLALAQQQVYSAQEAYDLAASQLAGMTLVSPIAGTVLTLNAAAGDTVAAGTTSTTSGSNNTSNNSSNNSNSSATPLVVVADLSQVQVPVSVNELDIASVAAGQPAAITLDAFPGRTFRGTVLRVGATATNTSGVITFPVLVKVDDTQGLLKQGLTATVTITTAQANNAVVVPKAAIQTNGNQKVVQVVGADGTLTARPVTTGLVGPIEIQVTAGLQPGEVIAIPGTGAATSRGGAGGGGRTGAGNAGGTAPPGLGGARGGVTVRPAGPGGGRG